MARNRQPSIAERHCKGNPQAQKQRKGCRTGNCGQEPAHTQNPPPGSPPHSGEPKQVTKKKQSGTSTAAQETIHLAPNKEENKAELSF